MAKWENFYKLVQQSNIDTSVVNDNQNLGGSSSFGTHNWYHKVVNGSGSRLSRYREWDMMDSDIDISRALDLIAEEITGNCSKSNDPIELNVIDIEHMTTSEVTTVKTALRHWNEIHRWKSKMFDVSRYVVKFGDIFFKKKDPVSKWIFVHPKDVLGAIVKTDNVTDVQGWQIVTDLNEVNGVGGAPVSGISSMRGTENYTIDEVIRFTLNNDMSENAPFGESVLKPIYKTFKQKELLEDAVIIYRIQRAPERRVFYIDVGKMPPNKVKQYLEGIKNEIRQKKIPTHNGNNSEIESVYNPQSQQEDYFLAQRCIILSTEIPLLNGNVKTLAELITDYKKGIDNWVYSINQKTGEYIPGKIDWAGPTRENAELIRIILSNGKYLDCTPDHKWILSDLSEIEAKDLDIGDHLSTLYIDKPSNRRLYVEKIECLDYTEDTGCLTIKDPGDNHNFAIDAGVYICNSDGRGSKIETLPGGASVGEISDVEYFSDKMFRGLRIPLSYMKEGDSGGSVFNDGKVGQAYITELRFSLYIERLQSIIEEVLDKEFKAYLRHIGLRIDNTKFNIVLPEPSNFGKYREQEMYAALLSTYSSADGIEYLSKKFIMKKYLQLTNDDILENERMKLEEFGEDPDNYDKSILTKLYAPDSLEPDIDGGMGPDMGSELGGPESMTPDTETPDIPADIPIE